MLKFKGTHPQNIGIVATVYHGSKSHYCGPKNEILTPDDSTKKWNMTFEKQQEILSETMATVEMKGDRFLWGLQDYNLTRVRQTYL